jgi:hypothetical protein
MSHTKLCQNHTHAFGNRTRECIPKNERVLAKTTLKIYMHACEFHTETCHFHIFVLRCKLLLFNDVIKAYKYCVLAILTCSLRLSGILHIPTIFTGVKV